MSTTNSRLSIFTYEVVFSLKGSTSSSLHLTPLEAQATYKGSSVTPVLASFHALFSASFLYFLPVFMSTVIISLLRVFLGLSWFLFPWGYHVSACLAVLESGYLNVWPIHLHLLDMIYWFVSKSLNFDFCFDFFDAHKTKMLHRLSFRWEETSETDEGPKKSGSSSDEEAFCWTALKKKKQVL